MFVGRTKAVTKLLARSLAVDAVAKRLQARPVGDRPIVAWHEVPGKAERHSTPASVRERRGLGKTSNGWHAERGEFIQQRDENDDFPSVACDLR
jgi:hypothetical protein